MATGEINQYVCSGPAGEFGGTDLSHSTIGPPEGERRPVIDLPVCGGRIGGRDIPPIP